MLYEISAVREPAAKSSALTDDEGFQKPFGVQCQIPLYLGTIGPAASTSWGPRAYELRRNLSQRV